MELAKQSNYMGCRQQNRGVELTQPVAVFIRMSCAQIHRDGAMGRYEITAKNLPMFHQKLLIWTLK